MATRRLVRRQGDGFRLKLTRAEQQYLSGMIDDLRDLLIAESPASDASVARLFPPAYPDDLLQNLDFERTAGSGLLAARLESLDKAAASIDAPRLSEEDLLTLMRVVNDLRLVLGTRLSVTEESEASSFQDEGDRSQFVLYQFLGWFISDIVDALAAAD